MADVRKGLIIVNTGPGKGKTTAPMGTALRAVGTGLKVLMLQFRIPKTYAWCKKPGPRPKPPSIPESGTW